MKDVKLLVAKKFTRDSEARRTPDSDSAVVLNYSAVVLNYSAVVLNYSAVVLNYSAVVLNRIRALIRSKILELTSMKHES